MPQESKLTAQQVKEMLSHAVETGNRLEVDEPLLVMPEPLPPPKEPKSQ